MKTKKLGALSGKMIDKMLPIGKTCDCQFYQGQSCGKCAPVSWKLYRLPDSMDYELATETETVCALRKITVENAKLIASAPELLAAAWQALFAIGAMGANADINHPYRKHWEQLQAAIAKAEGR